MNIALPDLPDLPEYFSAKSVKPDDQISKMRNKYLEETKNYLEKIKLQLICLETINKYASCRVDVTRIPANITNDVIGNFIEAGYKTTIKTEIIKEVDHSYIDDDAFRLGLANLKYNDVKYTYLYIT